MTSFLSRNALVIVIIGALALGGAWYAFSGSGASDDALLRTEVVDEVGSVETGIVNTLLTLRAVSLSGTIFSDPTFGALRDFGTQIISEPVGRPNPFAPREAPAGVGEL